MVKITVPSVLLVGALLQLVVHCNASGPVHIHLSLDGSTDQTYEKIKNQFQHNVEDLRDTSLADIKNTVKGRHIRLYISGDFAQKTPTDPHSDLFWDSGAKNAKYIADIVSKMFKDDAIVIVVFPKITQLFCGFEFLETFEQEIQKSHKDISIGREKMYFYFFLDDEKKNAEIKLFTFPHEEYKRISIAANKQLDLYNFASKEWSNGVDSISQVLIYEADTVEIRLESKCDDKDSKLTVAGHLPKSLANELLKAVKAEGHNHPYQTLRVKLPKVCGTDTQRSEFTEELINILREEDLDIYGKEPSAVIQFASVYPKNDDFVGHAMKKMEGVKKEYGNIRQYLAMFDHNNIVMTKEGQSITNIKTELSDIKELSIQVHCHGHFVKSQNYVCGLDANTLAAKLRNSQIVTKEISSIQIIFYACNVGTQKGQKFVLTFLDNLEGIHIHEVISFKSWVQQSDEEVQILVARQDNFKATTIIDEKKINKDNNILTGNLDDPVDIFNTLGAKWENYVFGRFTTRIKNKNSFAVLPKTELKL